ncbi:epididymal-specific lipocalin-9 [Nycticebus coucang]|uniref:epididymal-specific lipocalin-9 n=1 Tax=Nycticebus coucang TaxID=9470 RepID=UPI00234C6CFC|nr:epididymal-specific lipocalin-9 [Nycticebus coucang]
MVRTALLLLCLHLNLAWTQESVPRPVPLRASNMARVSGSWRSISMASNDLKRIEENGDLRVFIRHIEHLRNGSLKFDFRFMIQGDCVAVTVVCEKMKNDREYSIVYNGKNKVTVLETDFWVYLTFHLQNLRNGTKTQVLGLYGRIPQLDHSYLDRFKKICKTYGLSSQNIIDMTNQDHCPFKR